MKLLSNAHTHTTYCDGVADAARMVERAKALGFTSLGFSGHAAQGFDPAFCMTPDAQSQYFAEIRALNTQPDTPRLWAGLEVDSLALPELKRADYEVADYVIGSTHYLELNFHGAPVGVDGDSELLKAYVDDAFAGDGLAMAKTYFNLHASAALTDKPDVLGHFDLVRKYSAQLRLFDESGAAYRRVAQNALERAFPCGALLELNTGGMARGYLPTPYPTTELLGAWREMGGSVTVTSDCHDPRYLDFAFDKMTELLRACGYQSVKMLGARDRLWEDCEL